VDRRISGFHQDESGDWVADLECLHSQHVRHDPPFAERPWVLERASRSERIGQLLECPLCDRGELPPGLTVARVAGPFGVADLPAGLRRPHLVAAATWGELRVRHGSVDLCLPASAPPEHLQAGDVRALPPGVPHRIAGLSDDATLEVAFLVRSPADPTTTSP
jgi:tellurite resistance-related uncharacterized protein